MKFIRRVTKTTPWAVAVALALNQSPPAVSQVTRSVGMAQTPAPAPALDLADAVIDVQIAWLADPALFSCSLVAKEVADNVELIGYVPNEAIRQKALRIAKSVCGEKVVNHLKIHDGMAIGLIKPAAPAELAPSASTLLTEALGDKVVGLRIISPTMGRIEVSGNVPSNEDKLLVSKVMKKLNGCNQVVNKVNATGFLETPVVAKIPMNNGVAPARMQELPRHVPQSNVPSIQADGITTKPKPPIIAAPTELTANPPIETAPIPAKLDASSPHHGRSSVSDMPSKVMVAPPAPVRPPEKKAAPAITQRSMTTNSAGPDLAPSTANDQAVKTASKPPTIFAAPLPPIATPEANPIVAHNPLKTPPSPAVTYTNANAGPNLPVPDAAVVKETPRSVTPEMPKPVPAVAIEAPAVVPSLPKPVIPDAETVANMVQPLAKAVTQEQKVVVKNEQPKPTEVKPVETVRIAPPVMPQTSSFAANRLSPDTAIAKSALKPIDLLPEVPKPTAVVVAPKQSAPAPTVPRPADVEMARSNAVKAEKLAPLVEPKKPVAVVTETQKLLSKTPPGMRIAGKASVSDSAIPETPKPAAPAIVSAETKSTSKIERFSPSTPTASASEDTKLVSYAAPTSSHISGINIVESKPAVPDSGTLVKGVIRQNASTGVTLDSSTVRKAIEEICRGSAENVSVRETAGKQLTVGMNIANQGDWDRLHSKIKSLPEVAGYSVIYNVSIANSSKPASSDRGPMMGIIRTGAAKTPAEPDTVKKAIEGLCQGRGDDLAVRSTGKNQVTVGMKVRSPADWELLYRKIKDLPEVGGYAVIYNVTLK